MRQNQQYQNLLEHSMVNINGEILESSKAKISIFDRGFLYGDSIYEVTYSDENNILFFDEHLERLFNSANLLNMQMFITKDKIIKETMATLKAAKIDRAYIRIIVTRGETEITLDPNASFRNNLIIIVKPSPRWDEKYYNKGLHLYVSHVLRNDIKSVNPNAKSGNYLNNVMAMAEAKKMGADDAIMINHQGEVTEGTTSNIWIVKDNKFKTPPAKSGLLKGITREKIIEICQKNKLDLAVETFDTDELLNADEVFITSTTKGIMPVYKINSKLFGNGINDWANIKKLTSLYEERLNLEKQSQKYRYL